MKNLKTLNVKELSIDDQRNIDGGIDRLDLFLLAVGTLGPGTAIFAAGVYVGYREAEAANK